MCNPYTLTESDRRALTIVVSSMESRRNSARFFNDPVAWADYMLGATLWSKQRDLCVAMESNRNIAVKAGHGVGKSFLVSLLVCWWIDTRYPRAFVASTAPSQKQISAVVWREIRTMKQSIEERYKQGLIDHKLIGYITSNNEWKDDYGKLIGTGVRPPEQKEESAVQGIHEEYVLALGDESSGLSEEMIDALGNITSNDKSRRVLIGNPTNPGSHFAKIFKDNTGTWFLDTISLLDSPHFTDEKYELPEEVLSRLSGVEYVEEKKRDYGEDSPRYRARILGEFAYDMGDTLIKETDVLKATDNEVFVPDGGTRRILGCDIARFGKDQSVVYMCEQTPEGLKRIRLMDSWDHDARVTESANRIHRLALDYAVHEVRVDGHGIGGGVLDTLTSMDGTYQIIDMNSNAATNDKRKWFNARAFWWDEFRREMREGLIDLDLEDERLRDELCSVEYKYSKQTGGLLIESKDEMAKRGQKSPDFADACVYTSADMSHLTDPVQGERYPVGTTVVFEDDTTTFFMYGI